MVALLLDAPAGRVHRWPRRGLALLALVVTVVALAARLVPVLRGGGLTGVFGYDDGVYYTGAASLVAGRMPYTDFTLLHPPGILLVLAPFTVLGRLTSDHVGLAAARLAFIALGALNAGLITLLCARLPTARRSALAPAAVGGLFYALWYSSIYATRTTLLEGLGTTCLLVALAFAWRSEAPGRWAAWAAGAALGYGACTKIWGVVPLLVVAVWLARRHGRLVAVRLVTGAVVTAVVVCLPFLLRAPAAMPRMVVLDQLRRSLSTVSPVRRALDASSLHWNAPSLSGAPAVLVLAALALLVVAACVIAWRSGGTLPVLLLAATSVVLVASPSYFTHYGELVAAPLALVLAAAVAAWGERDRRSGRLRPSVVVPILALLLLELPTQARPMGRPLDVPRLRDAVASARCVATETPSMLAVTDVLSAGLDAGCVVPVDLTGSVYDVFHDTGPNGRAVPRLRNSRYQRYLTAYFMGAEAQVVVHPADTLLDATGLTRLRTNRLVAEDGSIRVYRRR